MKYKSLVIVVVSCLYSGCMPAYKVASAKDPFYTKGPIRSVLITTTFEQLNQQENLEEIAADEFINKKIVALRGSKVLPPLRTYTEMERNAVYTTNNIGGIIQLSIGNVNSSFEQYPTTTTRTKRKKIDSTFNRRDSTTRYDTTYVDEVAYNEAYSAIEVYDFTIVTTLRSVADSNIIWKAEVVVPYRTTIKTSNSNQLQPNKFNPTLNESAWGKVFNSIVQKAIADGVVSR